MKGYKWLYLLVLALCIGLNGTMAQNKELIVETKQGKLRGTAEQDMCVWKGIAYAKPPVVNLRFRAPQEPDSWTGVKDAIKYGPSSPQFRGPLYEKLEADENCLSLNIWSPAADGKKRPVMFWIHGGGFITGSGTSPLYDGTKLSKKGDVVVVTINYRLGPLGFLYFGNIPEAKGEFENNLGIKDQLAALKWVHDNIAAFGGDPEAVTIFGESAGAISVQTLMATPSAKGLFKRAIVESGNPEILWSPQLATDITNRYLAILNIKPNNLALLKTLPVDTLVTAMNTLMKQLVAEPHIMKLFAPTIDGDFIPRDLDACMAAGQCQGVDLLIGTNKNEANLFAMKRLKLAPTSAKELAPYLIKLDDATKTKLLHSYKEYPRKSGILSLLTDATFAVPSIRFAETQSTHASTYMYRFDWSSTALKMIGLKSCHGLELPFVFGTFDNNLGKKVTFLANKKHVHYISENMQQAWVNFARTGNPNSSSASTWKKYDSTDRCTMVFDKKIHTCNDPKNVERNAWNGINIFQ